MEIFCVCLCAASAIIVIILALVLLLCCRTQKATSRRAYEFQKLQSNEEYYEDDYLDTYSAKTSNLHKEYHDDPLHPEINNVKEQDASRVKLLQDYRDETSSEEEEFSMPLKT